MKNILILTIFSFVFIHCKNVYLFLLCLILLLLYVHQFNKLTIKHIILILIIYINSLHNFTLFNNIVLETHESYVIASINHQKVVIYTDEVYFLGDKIEEFDNQKEISSNSNFNLFNFEEYMKQKNITKYYDFDDVRITKKESIQRYVYNKICSLDEETSSVLLKIFYQFDTDNALITSSGMHYSTLNELFSSTFNTFISNFILILFGILFPFNFSLFRILIGNLLKMNNHLSLKERVGIQYLICMLFFPSSVYSLSFVLPFILNLIHIFVNDKKQKKIIQYLFMIFIQFQTFNQCELLNVFLFSFSRKMNACLLILGLFQIMFTKIKIIHIIYKILNLFSSMLKSIVFYGHVSLFVFCIFLISFIGCMHKVKYSCLICFLLLLYIPNQAYFNLFYTVDFINVGQGDSILIRAPFNMYNVIIDIPLNKEDEVIDYLHAYGINKIDTLIFTHDDSDHNGGKENFMNQFKVIDIIEEHKDIKNKHLSLISLNESIYEDKNSNSLVYYAKIGSLNYCFMGDASKEVELEIIEKYDLDCDVIKIGHHGSKTSTDPLFIQRINPTLAIISAGKNNIYGHPHSSVLEILNNYHVSIYQTSIHGSICIKSFLFFNFIITSSQEFGIMIAE